jgi:hypothetical protein
LLAIYASLSLLFCQTAIVCPGTNRRFPANLDVGHRDGISSSQIFV